MGWLYQAVGDPETVFLLLCWWSALIRGIHLQKILFLIGPGGAGKGTFQRLTFALIGKDNVAVTTIKDLETNRPELVGTVTAPAPVRCADCKHFQRIDHPQLGHCVKGQPEPIAGLWGETWRHCEAWANASASNKEEA